MGALEIDNLYLQNIRTLGYRLSKNTLPPGMASLFSRIDHGYNTRGSQANLIISRSDHRTIKYSVPKVWNSLPKELKASPSIPSFKKNSKNNLLAPYSSFTCSVRNCYACLNKPLPKPLTVAITITHPPTT